jgi:hypothetical protein
MAAFPGPRKRKLNHHKKKIGAGLVLLGPLLWVSPAHLRADTTTQHKSATTVNHKSSATPQRRAHRASQRHLSQAPTTASQHSSAHRISRRHISSRAARAAERRRRARLRPEPERIEQIQRALAQAGYFNGQPNGLWNDQTREAMRRYQGDHGFPATGLPEAKSLMKLGLGPHPLPADVDTTPGAKASGYAGDSTPPAPTTSDPAAPPADRAAQQSPPATTPQP